MFYVVMHGLPMEEVLGQGRYTKFAYLDSAMEAAEALKKDTGKQHDIFKIEWVTTTQTLGELMKEGRR